MRVLGLDGCGRLECEHFAKGSLPDRSQPLIPQSRVIDGLQPVIPHGPLSSSVQLLYRSAYSSHCHYYCEGLNLDLISRKNN